MSVVERILLDAGRRGYLSATVRGRAVDLPDLGQLRSASIAVHVIDADSALPAGADVVPGDEYLGVRIANEESRQAVESALLQMCPRPFDGPGDHYVLRHLSPLATRALARLGLTSEHATWVALATGVVAVALLAIGGRVVTVVGGLTLLLHLVLDAADDELVGLRRDDTQRRRVAASIGADVIDAMTVAALGAGLGGGWATLGFFMAIAWGGARAVAHLSVRRAGTPWETAGFRWWFEEDVPPDIQRWLDLARGRDTYLLMVIAPCLLTLEGLALFVACVLAVANAGLAAAHAAIAGVGW